MNKRQTRLTWGKRRQRPDSLPISRRRFLRDIGAAAAGLLVAGCRGRQPVETIEATSAVAAATRTAVPPTTQTASPDTSPTATPTAPPVGTAAATATRTAVPPTATPTATRVVPLTATQTPTTVAASPTASVASPRAWVSIAQARNYDRKLVREQVRALLDGLGGLGDVVSHGDRVAIKVNLTGGTHFEPPPGVSATESYLTHPEVVRALCEMLRDAGARELFIVEAVFDDESYKLFGYEEVAEDLGATLIDLNKTTPYGDFAAAPVGKDWFIYPDFTFNHILEDVDAFISVAKMKCHYNCGVTHSMKNLVGLVPANHYALEKSHWWRSALHGHSIEEARSRLPKVILDLVRARPIHLALIDGIKTGEGGEAPRGSFAPVAPGILIAGKDPVAADAVATATMGFDPTVEPPAEPFLRGDNYLNLAYGLGLGTNRLPEIKVVGTPIDDVLYEFKPSREM